MQHILECSMLAWQELQQDASCQHNPCGAALLTFHEYPSTLSSLRATNTVVRHSRSETLPSMRSLGALNQEATVLSGHRALRQGCVWHVGAQGKGPNGYVLIQHSFARGLAWTIFMVT